ncbi:latrophilin-like protein LAT-2 isoform X2 [Saccostrea echinata]|uniref:latrophilin-like protein LAT-2 isoform X2 n=1 Tax=Saccostrea echinata TaxID=191078 RepID=UPI002A7F724A|nr:latrophilin-like protein LAT-2 isoform X2 [Saccostrea echinata]
MLQMIPRDDLSIESKESINLLCVVTNPESLFNLTGGGLFWQKDGKKILSDSGFNINTTVTSTTLKKSSAEVDDTGTYLCSHAAYPDPINVSININITEPKSVEILSFESSGSLLREGKSLRFESEILLDPALNVQWFHNGILINNSSRYTITSSITNNGTSIHVLQIFNVLLQDEGEWNVTASNGVTTETKSIRIQVLQKLKLQIIPKYDFSIQSGEGIDLECTVINPESLKNLSGGSLIWQKDGQKILSGFIINTTNSSTQLRKSSSEIDESGRYSCLHSAYPDPVNVSIYVNVTEPEPIEMLSLKINKPVLLEGEPAWFEAEIVNKSGLIVQWFHNGILITDALSRFRMTSSTTANNTSLYVLNIASVILQDEGNWNITASNGLTTASRGISLQVLPRISLHLTPQDDFSIQTGKAIHLLCEALYSETPAYSTGINLNWKKDGNNISSDPRFNISKTAMSTTLHKSSAALTDSGHYSCLHSVYSNTDDISVDVNVTEPDKDKPCPCQHGGTCINSICACPVGYQGRYCENEYIDILSYKRSNSVIREGKSVWFQSEIVGPVGFKVQWSRNGILISNTASRYVMFSSQTENGTSLHILNITSVLQRDEGYWTATVSTDLTTEAKNITISVLPKLLLQMTPQYDFLVKSGESLNLRCTVINPKSLNDLSEGSLIWKKDGGNILSDTGFNISTTNTSTTLEKERADLSDAGSFSCSHSSYPDPVSVSISISVTKPEQIRCADDKINNIIWKSTIAGTTKKESCPENQKGTATRYCNLQGVWDSPNLINCTDVALANANEELDSIIADGITENVDEAVNNTLVKMKNLTSKSSVLSAGDISSSLDILEKIVNVTNLTSANVEKEAFFEVVDNVLSTNNSKSWTAVSDKTEKDASSLLKNMDRMSEVVLKKENVTASKFKGKNFEVSVDQTKVDEKGIVFPEKSEKTPNDTSSDTEEYSTFLELPKQTNKIEKAITYVAVIYKTISDILPTDSSSETEESSDAVTEVKEKKKKEFVNSEILSLTTQTDLGILSPPLSLAFQHKHENESADLKAVCVSWDYTINKWSEKGCKVNSTNTKRTVCQCNHLTNFAILMRPYTPETEDGASLKTLSLVGVIISIAFTVLTFIIFILTWKQVKSDQNIMLLNLCGSLVVSYIVFIAAVEKTENEAVCTFVTALIHYLFLVTFFSMLSMGIYYCMSITVTFYAMYVANNFKSKTRVQWFLLGSWGIPLIIAAITLGAFWGNNYHLKHYCWLSMESGSLFLFIVPVCLIAVINIIIMVSLIRVLCASSAMTKSSLQKKAASGLRSLGTLLPVLGVTWIFGVLAVNESAEIFQYIFIIANSLQGFCIFISHVLLNKKLMLGIKTKYPSLSGLSMFTESSKKETSSVSRSHSSRSEAPLVKPKKKRILPIFGIFSSKKTGKNNKVMKSDSFMTDKTVSTDCPCSETQENSITMTETGPKEEESAKMIFKEVKTNL